MIGEAIPVGADTRDPERWNAKLDLLYDAALSTFGARCLWNVKPSKSVQGMRVVAQCLRASGGMDAWRLATEIRDAIVDAAG